MSLANSIVFLLSTLAVGLGAAATLRYRKLRRPRYQPITPVELKQKLDSGEKLLIVDLRHPLDVLADPRSLPGAIRCDQDGCDDCKLVGREYPVIFYGTSLNAITCERAAAQLAKRGFSRLRPLQGGMPAWQAAGLPLQPVDTAQLMVKSSVMARQA